MTRPSRAFDLFFWLLSQAYSSLQPELAKLAAHPGLKFFPLERPTSDLFGGKYRIQTFGGESWQTLTAGATLTVEPVVWTDLSVQHESRVPPSKPSKLHLFRTTITKEVLLSWWRYSHRQDLRNFDRVGVRSRE